MTSRERKYHKFSDNHKIRKRMSKIGVGYRWYELSEPKFTNITINDSLPVGAFMMTPKKLIKINP